MIRHTFSQRCNECGGPRSSNNIKSRSSYLGICKDCLTKPKNEARCKHINKAGKRCAMRKYRSHPRYCHFHGGKKNAKT